jgi:cytochrome c biogenesis protein CcdA
VLALAAYNLVYALPFAIVPVLRATLGERSQNLLERINRILDKAGSVVLPILMALLALALLADAAYYFVTGAQLIKLD